MRPVPYAAAICARSQAALRGRHSRGPRLRLVPARRSKTIPEATGWMFHRRPKRGSMALAKYSFSPSGFVAGFRSMMLDAELPQVDRDVGIEWSADGRGCARAVQKRSGDLSADVDAGDGHGWCRILWITGAHILDRVRPS